MSRACTECSHEYWRNSRRLIGREVRKRDIQGTSLDLETDMLFSIVFRFKAIGSKPSFCIQYLCILHDLLNDDVLKCLREIKSYVYVEFITD